MEYLPHFCRRIPAQRLLILKVFSENLHECRIAIPQNKSIQFND